MADMSLFNILVSILMLVVGFLLNRVFSEIDKINKAHAEARESMLTEFIAKDEFIRHQDSSARATERMGEDIGRRFDKIDVLLEAVRVKQQSNERPK